jgi:small subunit ribosomal protein S9
MAEIQSNTMNAPAEGSTVAPASATATAPSGPTTYVWGTGRRKTSVARVRIRPGSGKILVNERELNDYFTNERDRKAIFGPFEVTNTGGKLDMFVRAGGGGLTGQAGAVILGLARALARYDSTLEQSLRNANFLTRDPRMKERKKYGQRGARRRFQFSKR